MTPKNDFSLAPFQIGDLTTMKGLLEQANGSAGALSKTLTTGFASAATSGKSLNETLVAMAESLAKTTLKAGAQSLASGLVSGVGALLSGALGGGGGRTPAIAPFAEGGVVASPTYFGSNGAMGLMGERGAEAIMPLARGPDGTLGVSMHGGQSPVSVTVNIAAQDVESFRRSEAQITGALARAVARGRRSL